jgi:hypothetical protein
MIEETSRLPFFEDIFDMALLVIDFTKFKGNKGRGI